MSWRSDTSPKRKNTKDILERFSMLEAKTANNAIKPKISLIVCNSKDTEKRKGIG